MAAIASKEAWLQTAAGKKYGPAGYATYVKNMQAYNAAQTGTVKQSAPSNNTTTTSTAPKRAKLDVYDKASIDQYMRANPQWIGGNLGGTYYKNPYYNPSSTQQGSLIHANAGAGGINPERGGEGPFYYTPLEGSSAPSDSVGGGGGTPSGGGMEGGSGLLSYSPPSGAGVFEPRQPAKHNVVRTGPEAETTQGQLVNVIDQDGPLMRRARTQGLQIMNDRGLINSSMSSGAAMGAMLEQAVPIAMSDANTFFTNSLNNLNAENQYRAANNAAYLESILQAQQGEIQKALTHIAGGYGLEEAGIGARVSYMDMWLRLQTNPYITGDMKSNLGGYLNPYLRPIA